MNHTMNHTVNHTVDRDLPTADGDILAFNVPDDALERAAVISDGQAITITYCTNWYDCGWPL
jgi:hypothetical protein